MRVKTTTMLAAAALATAPAAANPQDVTDSFSPAYQACITYGETNGTPSIPQGECNARELRSQDARLNAAYKAVLARRSPVRKGDLRTDERNWIEARDRKCAAQPDPDLTTECTIAETMKRTAYLRRNR